MIVLHAFSIKCNFYFVKDANHTHPFQVIDAWSEIQTATQMSVEDYEQHSSSLGTNPQSGLSYCFPTIWKVFTQH